MTITTTGKTQNEAWTYLKAALKHHPQATIARHLKVDVRTVRRWEVRQNQPPPYLVHALQTLLPLLPPRQQRRYRQDADNLHHQGQTDNPKGRRLHRNLRTSKY